MNKNERPAFLKGKGAAVGAVLCFVAVITMVGSYTYNHYKKDMEQQIKDENAENKESQKDVQQENENSMENGNISAEEIQSTASSNTQDVWFTQESTLAWPASGATLLSFSMDHTVYFPTLEQYKYNPALIIGGTQGEVIHAAAAGVVESIEQTAQTGTTVTLDMGNGYTAVYGQLDQVAAAVGDYIAAGEEVGTLNSPTKYYSVEGPNLYFEIMKDGAPVDPMNFME